MDAKALASFESTVALRGGERARLRPIRPDDEPRLAELYDRLGRRTIYQRFFTVMQRLPPDWAHFLANVDGVRRFALVAEDPASPSPTLIGVARYEWSPDDDAAELAFVVQDDWQGKGLGTWLVRELLRAAELNGLRRFRAYVLGENRRMMDVFLDSGFSVTRRLEAGVQHVVLSLTATPAFEERAAARARVAATASGTVSVLAPLGMAVLGRRTGEGITWEAPGGTRRIRVDEVLYQPERDGADVT